MASVKQPHSRLRSSSDPFSDPSRTNSRTPPPPPPKVNRMPTTVPRSAPPHRESHRDIVEAVRDTVTVRHSEQSQNPRTRMGRSQTTLAAPSTQRPTPVGRRSHSQDSVLAAAAAVEKAKAANKNRPKKGSAHADVIDRLDFTGVGPMFHHDGPFDACAPSRNRHRTKAPMLAWSSHPTADPALQYNDSPYPAPEVYKALSNTYEPPKKKVDAIAEAWGIHEPEPYEEFFAGGAGSRTDGDTPNSSIYHGKDGNRSGGGTPRRSKESRDLREAYNQYLEEGPQPQNRTKATTRRSMLPPPQPIFVPDAQTDFDAPIVSPGSPGNIPKRSKSLMHRLRKMREAPNVPVGAPYEEGGPPSPPSPSSVENSYSNGESRPTHRSQNSFLGRFSGGSRANNQREPTGNPPTDSYVYVEEPMQDTNKDLPATPASSGENGYFDAADAPTTGYGGAQATGIGRKTSLLKKVGRAVRKTR